MHISSFGDADRLRTFFRDCGYTETNLKRLGFRDLASSRLRNLPRLRYKTAEPSTLNTLLRWFWLGLPQARSEVQNHVPSQVLNLLLTCGLVSEHQDELAPQAMLMEAAGFLIASDYTAKIDREDPELVLWPNPTSRLLLRMAIRKRSRATLDLGTGTGIQAIAAAAHSDRVVATDLSARAVQFAAFNAALNGARNVTVLSGDSFQPVAGEKFDLIVSNPPFFISPSAKYLFCNNDLELDQLCRRLVLQAPEFLNEGGYLEMLCEWAEVQGETWEQRISGWLGQTGCDAIVTKAYTRDPAEYAEEQIRSTVSSSIRDAEAFAEYMNYYRDLHVRFIHGGTIVMRRRSAATNWILIEENGQMPQEPFGEAILRRFEVNDFLQVATEQELLQVRPRLDPDAYLEQVFCQAAPSWKSQELNLKIANDKVLPVALQPLVAEFVGACDGSVALQTLIESLASKVSVPAPQVQAECIQIVRRLLQHGFLFC